MFNWGGGGSTAYALADKFKAQTAAAKAAMEYDKNVLSSAAQSIGRLNVARAGMYRQATSALASIRAKKRATAGQVGVSLAATDTVGASATAALADVSVQADQAVAQVRRNVEVSDWNMNNTHADILQQASTSLRGDRLEAVLTKAEADRIVFRGFAGGVLGTYTPTGPSTSPSASSGNSPQTDKWEYRGDRAEDPNRSSYTGEDQKFEDQGESMGGWAWEDEK